VAALSSPAVYARHRAAAVQSRLAHHTSTAQTKVPLSPQLPTLAYVVVLGQNRAVLEAQCSDLRVAVVDAKADSMEAAVLVDWVLSLLDVTTAMVRLAEAN